MCEDTVLIVFTIFLLCIHMQRDSKAAMLQRF